MRTCGGSAIVRLAALLVGGIAARAPAGAQDPRRVEPSPATVAIAAGRFNEAEALLFEASRRIPREPAARGALGAFLAARGRLLVGATLLEEALEFGADSAAVEARLFDVYRWAARFDRAAGQRTARVSPGLREAMTRAAGTVVGGAESAQVPMRPNEALGLGRIPIAIGEERLEADIQPLATGLVLPATMALFAAVEPVGGRGDTTFAVVRALSVGGVTLGPVPAALVPSAQVARLGFDLLGHLQPTLDHRAQQLVVRSAVAEVSGQRLPLLLTFPGVTFVAREGEAPVGLHTAAGRAALRGRRWTLDLAGGAIVVER